MKHLTQSNIDRLQKRLEEERDLLHKELQSVAVADPANPQDWNSVDKENLGARNADPNTRGDHFEEIDTNSAISDDLETRLVEVSKALAKVEEGTYGVTDEGEEIPLERLEANPAAATLVK